MVIFLSFFSLFSSLSIGMRKQFQHDHNIPYKVQYRRLRMDLIMMYKILQGIVHLRKDHFFIMNTNPTRTNGLKIYKHHCNKTLRRYSFSQRIIDHWNRLPSEIVNALNLLSFKTQLDIFLSSLRFKYV